uniref:Olfactory receptor n=1 Tax=Latimeria chalumnae TaxID=7897 RepID=H2ZYW0_LATCH
MVYLNNCNETDHFVQEFILLGFAGLQHSQTSLFFVFLFAYLIILVGNVMILLIVTSERKLHTPMYIFLRSLSILDIIYPTVILPKMLALFLVGDNIISFFGCFAQMYFFLSFGTVESILLSVMSFDRYLAICSPLRYPTIMTNQVCTMLIISVYFLGFLTPVVAVVFLMQLPYRGPRIINHCYCDYPSVLNLACSDTAFILDMAFTSAIIVIFGPFLLVVFSYIKVIQTILGLKSVASKEKAFSTCASHLFSVIIFYASNASVYIAYRVSNISNDFRILIAIIYAIINPMVHPLIYTLRNKGIKKVIARKRKILYVTFSDKNAVATIN